MSIISKLASASPWPAAIAAVFTSWLQVPMLRIYERVHWGAMFRPGEKLPELFYPPLAEVLSILDIYRPVAGVAGVAFALWALLSRLVAMIIALPACVVGVILRM
jgi:hypothetical protein